MLRRIVTTQNLKKLAFASTVFTSSSAVIYTNYDALQENYTKVVTKLSDYITWNVSTCLAKCIDNEYLNSKYTKIIFDYFSEDIDSYGKNSIDEQPIQNIVNSNNKSVRPMLLHLMRDESISVNCENLFEAWIQRILIDYNREVLPSKISSLIHLTNTDDDSDESLKTNTTANTSSQCANNIETETIIRILDFFIKKIPTHYFSRCSNFIMDSLNQESDWNLFTNNERFLFSNIHNDGVPMVEPVYDQRASLFNHLKILRDFIVYNYDSDVVREFVEKDEFLNMLLLVIYKYNDDLRILVAVANIIQSLTMKYTDMEYFEKFIPFLYSSNKRKNNELHILATNILTNLDRMDPYKINHGLYILSQNVSIEGKYSDCVDVILIHGINGSPLKTWRILGDKKSATNYTLWPKQWLAKDIPNIRIISIGFDSKFLRWHLDCPSSSFRVPEASRYLIKSLVEAGVGQRPIIWIGHSIGGILIKDIITKCNRKASQDIKYCDRLSKMTKGTIFYSVPHHGTPIAFKLDYLIPAFDTKYVKNDCGFTSKLNANFVNYLKEHHILCLNFAESLPTSINFGINLVIVPPDCSDIKYGQFIVLERTHSQTCKPENLGDISYTATKKFVDNIVSRLDKI